jgi:hypothetical protein
MYQAGDLVQVSLDCGIKYFSGKLAIVVQCIGQDTTEYTTGWYYKIQFDNGKQHIFYDKELTLLSKAERK